MYTYIDIGSEGSETWHVEVTCCAFVTRSFSFISYKWYNGVAAIRPVTRTNVTHSSCRKETKRKAKRKSLSIKYDYARLCIVRSYFSRWNPDELCTGRNYLDEYINRKLRDAISKQNWSNKMYKYLVRFSSCTYCNSIEIFRSR